METVKNVDLTKYAGRWYEIASMPSRFQPKSGTNARATYTLNEDKTIHVLNETWVGGKRSFIEGKAWKADASSEDAKLLVKFWVPPFLPLFPVTGDYWVLALEEENYSYALVGQPSKKFLWVSFSLCCFSHHRFRVVFLSFDHIGLDWTNSKGPSFVQCQKICSSFVRIDRTMYLRSVMVFELQRCGNRKCELPVTVSPTSFLTLTRISCIYFQFHDVCMFVL